MMLSGPSTTVAMWHWL